MTVTADRVTAVRAFTRFYTTVIGALDEGLLRSPYTLTEARVIFELAQVDRHDVADLRRVLDLDAGYLSRILARFEADGLVVRARSRTDARRQVIRLTSAGRSVFALLDARSAEQVAAMLDALPEPEQDRLVAAMEDVRSILAGTVPARVVELRALRPGDLGWVVQRHGEVYAAEYGWDEAFEALVARIAADYAAHHEPARENAWIAELDGRRAGSIFCVRGDEPETAKLRLLLVEPSARGAGVGTRLVDECVEFARNAGYRTMTLWTVDILDAARRVYQRAGFELVAEEARQRRFGADLAGQHWKLRL